MASMFSSKLAILGCAILALQIAAQETYVRTAGIRNGVLQVRDTQNDTRTVIRAPDGLALAPRRTPPMILVRAEPEGGDCSPEGQWNCMPDTWQRCASGGKWTQAMSLAEGTICTPEGLTEDITIEHDGSVNGGDSGDDSANDGGTRHGVAARVAVAASIFALL